MSKENQIHHHSSSYNSPHNLLLLSKSSIFDTLNDDVLFNILELLDKQSYITFGLINKKCNNIFSIYGIPKETRISLLPVASIDQICCASGNGTLKSIMYAYLFSSPYNDEIAKGVVIHSRDDLLVWVLQKRKDVKMIKAIYTCALEHNRLDIVKRIFVGADANTEEKLRNDKYFTNLAASSGNLEALKYLYNIQRCVIDVFIYEEAVCTENPDLLEWLESINFDNNSGDRNNREIEEDSVGASSSVTNTVARHGHAHRLHKFRILPVIYMSFVYFMYCYYSTDNS